MNMGWIYHCCSYMDICQQHKKSVSESCDSFDCAYTVIILLYIRNVDENYKYCDIHGYWNAV